MENRIRAVRKHFRLTQTEFGEKLGVSKDVIVNAELGRAKITDLFTGHICAVFGVNEEWLRTGQGEMLRQDNQSILDRMAEEYKFTQQERAVLNAYLDLSPQDRAAVMRYVDNLVAELAAQPAPVSDASAAAVAAMQDYAAMVAEEKSPPENSSTSAG